MTKDANIELWFPTPIYFKDNILTKNEINQLEQEVIKTKNNYESNHGQWFCNVYTSYEKQNIVTVTEYDIIKNKVTDCVNEFVQVYGSAHKYECNNGWINIYSKYNFQEFHYHHGHTFSAVYFLKAPEGSGSLIFNNPNEPDMLPIKNISIKNNMNYAFCEYQAVENRLIIFRASLQHMVKQGTNKTDRITLSFNF